MLNNREKRKARLTFKPRKPEKSYKPLAEEDELKQAERLGPFGTLEDIKEEPIPKGTLPETIQNETIDWHDLEDFVLSISPYKFVTLMKLKNQILREQLLKYARNKPFFNKTVFIWLLIAVGCILLGLFFYIGWPMIQEMLSGASSQVVP